MTTPGTRRARWALACALGLLGPLVQPASAAQRCGGVDVPARIDDAAGALVLNGVGVREVTLLRLRVYVAALYLRTPMRDAPAILAPDVAKTMRLTLLRDVDRADMGESIQRGFARAAGAQLPRHRPALTRLLSVLPDLADGESVALSWRPGAGLAITHVARHGPRLLARFDDADFARTLFAIWLGEPPLARGLERRLLGAPCD